VRVAIIGGGISGLAAAHFFERAGHDVVCIDAAPQPGGVMRSERIDGFLCEVGPQAVLDGPADTRALIAAAGLEPRTLRAAPAARRRFIHARGRLHPLPMNPIALIRSALLTWRGKLRLLREPFVRAAPADDARDESVLEFGARRFGPEAARALLATAVLGIYAGDAARLSVKSALPRLAAFERARGSVLRGALAQRRAGGGSGRPLSFPEGLQELPRALAQKLGARRIVARAAAITRADDRWRVSLEPVAPDGPALAAPHVDAQAVVVAADPAPAAGLLDPLCPNAAAALRAVPRAPVAVVCLGFRPGGAPLGIDLRAYGFLVARPDGAEGAAGASGAAILGCQYESSTFPDRAPAGGVLLRAILGGVFEPGIVQQPDASIAARTLAELRQLIGLTREPDFLRIWRHPAGIPQYEVGHAALVAAADRDLQRHRGLYLLGHALRGVGVNDCIAAAAALARQTA
jgi:oxygen-dependent protoporphyrinogen oxidase